MTRRFLGLLAGALALPALASCATFDTDDAAKVNGTSISSDDLNDLRDGLIVGGPALQIAESSYDETGAAGGDLTRQALSLLIDNAVLAQVLADAGASPTVEQLSAAADQVRSSAGDDLPAGLVDPLAFQQVASEALSNVPAPDAAALEAIYADRPSAFGVVCLRIIGAPDEGAAGAAVEALRSGGVVDTADGTTDDTGCAGVDDLEGAVGADVAAQLTDGEPGFVADVVAPNPATGGTTWQVLQVLPYEQAAEPLAQVFGESPGQMTRAVAMLNADVSVDPQYGRWDSGTQSVVPV